MVGGFAGIGVGLFEGCLDGIEVDGRLVGVKDGVLDGRIVGALLGVRVGERVVGRSVGADDGRVGLLVGDGDGFFVGLIAAVPYVASVR
jgi:hypothetical protein